MRVPGTAPKWKLKFVLKGGIQSLCTKYTVFAMHKIYYIVPKITVLTEYEMDFLRTCK